VNASVDPNTRFVSCAIRALYVTRPSPGIENTTSTSSDEPRNNASSCPTSVVDRGTSVGRITWYAYARSGETPLARAVFMNAASWNSADSFRDTRITAPIEPVTSTNTGIESWTAFATLNTGTVVS